MKLPSIPSSSLIDDLNQTYFGRLWNSTDDHGRANFKIEKVVERIKTGSVSVDRSVVGLPTTDSAYAVYRSPYSTFGRFIVLPQLEWISAIDVLAGCGVDVSVYSAEGKKCPLGATYLRFNPITSTVLVAVKSNATNKTTGTSYPSLYATVNFDTTRTSPVVKRYYEVSTKVGSTSTPAIVGSAISSAVMTCPIGTTVNVNGFIYIPSEVPTIVNGDVVEISSDPDIVGSMVITVDDAVTGYYSDMYSEYREILHIPKSLNPNNYIITNDTIDYVAYDPVTKRGLYGVRLDPHAVESVTHNDFSIPRTVVQALQNSLGSQSVELRVYVRYATNPILLKNDVNHISDLYSLSDDEIQKQLTGTSTKQIAEWKASYLEQSEFLSLLYTFSGFSGTQTFENYINAMGYFDVVSTTGNSMRYFTYKGARAEIFKPARLYGYPCDVIVYAGGRKVPDQYVQVTDYRDISFYLGFDSQAVIPIGTRIAAYVIERDSRIPVTFDPTSSNNTITLPNSDYTFVRRFAYSDPKTIWNGTTSNGYGIRTSSSTDYQMTQNTDGTVTYHVQSNHWGSRVYFIPKYGVVTEYYSIDSYLNAKQGIIIDLKMTDTSGGLVPIMAYETAEIYLNGYRLIPNVDYQINNLMGDNTDVLQSILVVSNKDYLQLGVSDNTIEVVVHGDSTVSQDSGYAISNMLYRQSSPAYWTPECGRTFVGGLLVENVNESGNILTVSPNVGDGSAFYVQWDAPFSVNKLLAQFSPSFERTLEAKIDQLLGLQHPNFPNTVVVSHQYALYSPFLAQVGYDVANGLFTIVDEPKDDAFLKQFAHYKPIVDVDPVLGASNTAIDRRFVTIAAHYANISTSDPVKMIRLQRLIALVLAPSALSIREVLL